MIVQCPDCKTKFSIDQEKFSGISRPRFHCSKCSHNFYLSSEKPKTPQQLELEPQTESHPFQRKSPSSSKEITSEVMDRPSWPSYDIDKINPLIIEDNELNNEEFNASIQRSSIEYSDLNSNLAYKEKIDTEITNSAPIIDEEVDEKLKDINEYSFDDVEKFYEHGGGQLINDPNSYDEIQDINDYQSEETSIAPISSPYENPQRADIRFLGMTFSDAVLFSSVPIILYLVFSFFFPSSDNASGLLSSVGPTLNISSAQVPPGTVVLGEPFGELIELADGNSAIIIEAEMVNNSDGDIVDISLEADLYSRDNNRLVRKIIPFPNTLSEKILLEDIPTNKLNELQDQPVESPKFILLPRNSKPARVAIINPPEDAVWFNLIVRSAHWADPKTMVDAGLIEEY